MICFICYFFWQSATPRKAAIIKKKLNIELPSNGSAEIGYVVAMATGPGRWLVESEDEHLEANLRQKIAVSEAAVTGLTHARTIVTISGEKADWVLASGIPLDFHQSAFKTGDVQMSHHHEIGLTIRRTSEQSYDLYVFTSYARSFWQWIARASAEVGYRVV